MPNAAEIRVHGLRELNRAFAKADRNLSREMRKSLKEVAEPVRAEAKQRAIDEISNVGPDWSDMRVGVTTQVVYVAPGRRRRSGSPRPNFGTLLMERAMLPALEAHTDDVERELERMLERVGKDWERTG